MTQTLDRRGRDRRVGGRRRQVDAPPGTPERARVLLVEPHDDTRLLYTSLFEETGWRLYAAADGPSALGIAEHRLPDVIVTEIALPRMDGFGLMERLRANPLTADIPILVVTSMVHFEIPRRVRASGADAVLEKPTPVHTLLSAAERLMAATPQERIGARQLRRSLIAVQQLARHLEPSVEASERIRSLIDELQVGILAFDQQGRYVAASAAASAFTGYSREEILEMSVSDTRLNVPPPEDRTDWEAAVHIERRDGRRISVRAACETILPGLYAAVFDDVEAKRVAAPSS